ncbi:gtp-binding protein rho4 [Anaeramoeba ignava]|uniref:Gtp-binding protein rho4 n=1 Tax=Anaeramoeba ignava TaxID=1746090 RepID=A0A9Q0R5T0_ANAIG|nr:gtp-binding protein rho4 [Anaeramoeba ignava]
MPRFKLVVIGDGAVGKTALCMTFASNEFPEEHIPTVFEQHVRDIDFENKTYELEIFDTAGQEDLGRIRSLSYNGANALIVCYSVDLMSSFHDVKENWIKEGRHYCPKAPIILVALKSDLRKDQEAIDKLTKANQSFVTIEQGKKLSEEIQAYSFHECSAKLKENIDDVFIDALKASKENIKKESGCIIL